MFVKKSLASVMVILTLLACCLGVCVAAGNKGPAAVVTQASTPAKAERVYKYICPCKPKCDCLTISDKPGNCVCGKQMLYRKILREDANNYYFCTACGVNCACTEADKKKNELCDCGKPLQAFLKKGAFVCACGPKCDCGTQSNKAGNCPCGKPLAPVKK